MTMRRELQAKTYAFVLSNLQFSFANCFPERQKSETFSQIGHTMNNFQAIKIKTAKSNSASGETWWKNPRTHHPLGFLWTPLKLPGHFGDASSLWLQFHFACFDKSKIFKLFWNLNLCEYVIIIVTFNQFLTLFSNIHSNISNFLWFLFKTFDVTKIECFIGINLQRKTLGS